MSTTLRRQVGETFIVGLEGTSLTGQERAWLRLLRPAGVILFRRNIESASQTQALLAEATALCAEPGFRFVDLEGGLVDRLRDAVAPMPAAQEVAATGKLRLAEKHGRLIAREIKAFGFNSTLAPVLDLGLPESAAVMKTRTASPDPEKVTAYASAFLEGLAAEKVIGCGKHFPGLGGGDLDSHEATPFIHRTLSQLEQTDMLPYRKLKKQLPIVMISHAAFPETRGGNIPASASPWWIRKILREKLGYRGLVLSDDMEMGGILKHKPMEEAAVAAVAAGNNLIEICHSPELIFRAYEAVLSEAERSAAFRRIVAASASLVRRTRVQRLFLSSGRPATEAQIHKLREAVLRFHTEVEAQRV